ncbi:histidine kinase [halophilic archaeon]|nr:histidine kinase [halophilic archaeon]
MDDIFVGRLMSTTLYTVSPKTLVEEAAQTMLTNNISSVLVADSDNQLEGILTTTDFVRIVSERRPKEKTPVDTYMTTDVITATAQDSIRDAADNMLDQGCHHLPVVDDTEGVIGMLSTTDIAAYLSRVQTPSPA